MSDKIIETNINAIKLVAKRRKRFVPSIILNELFDNLSPYITIYMSAEIVSELAGSKSLKRLFWLVLITVTADLAVVIIGGFIRKLKDYEWEAFANSEKIMFMEYGFTLDYEHLENPEIRQKRRKIDESKNINNLGIWSMLISLQSVTGNLVNIILSVSFMSSLFVLIFQNADSINGALVYPLTIVGLISLTTFIQIKNSKKISELYEGISNNMLNINRVGNAFDGYQAGKDIRVYNMISIHNKIHEQLLKSHIKGNRKFHTGYHNATIPNLIITQGLNFPIYAFVCLNAVRGLFEIGSVIKYAGFINRLVTAIKDISGSIATIKMNAPFLRHYLDFFEIENKMYQGTIHVEKRDDNEYEIEFKSVSFKYPNSEKYALKNLSMKLKIGERMAVVGMNGSGKTTMIKLLCRLYDPTEGEITLNGINIKKYDYNEYLSIFSVVFQDFKLFPFTIGQNVVSSVDVDSEKALHVLDMAGFSERLASMPKGLETAIYKDFEQDGVEISGGEAQKIALARALYKNAPFIVLDEPTSALDPIAEFEVYSKFNEIVDDKTTIYISHRLSSCRFCNDIAVFHEGEMIQRGNHDTLISDVGGKYYELWNAQAQYYNEKAV